MKTIKCSKCEKNVLVENGYQLKTCQICLAKRKADYAVESAERDFDKESEKQLKRLFGENPPSHLSYGKMKEFYQTHFHRELSWEQYLRDIQQAAIHKIRTDSDEKVREIKGEKAKRIKYNAKFLDFDLYPPSNRDECKKFRHQVMGSYPQIPVFLEEHIADCPECKMWNEVKESGNLNAEGTAEIWQGENHAENIINLTPYNSEECKTFRLMYAGIIERTDLGFLDQRHITCCSEWKIKYRISIGEIKKPTTFEELESSHNFKPCCLECGTNLVNDKCPNCQPIT